MMKSILLLTTPLLIAGSGYDAVSDGLIFESKEVEQLDRHRILADIHGGVVSDVSSSNNNEGGRPITRRLRRVKKVDVRGKEAGRDLSVALVSFYNDFVLNCLPFVILCTSCAQTLLSSTCMCSQIPTNFLLSTTSSASTNPNTHPSNHLSSLLQILFPRFNHGQLRIRKSMDAKSHGRHTRSKRSPHRIELCR